MAEGSILLMNTSGFPMRGDHLRIVAEPKGLSDGEAVGGRLRRSAIFYRLSHAQCTKGERASSANMPMAVTNIATRTSISVTAWRWLITVPPSLLITARKTGRPAYRSMGAEGLVGA